MKQAKIDFIEQYISNFGESKISRKYLEHVFEQLENEENRLGKNIIEFSKDEELKFGRSLEIKTLLVAESVSTMIETYKSYISNKAD